MTSMINRDVLVLNRNWTAINVTTVETVLKKVWTGNAKIVDPSDYMQYTWEDWSKMRPEDGDPYINCVNFRLKVPEVVTLSNYGRIPNASVAFSRRNLYQRDKYTCQYCGKQPGTKLLTIDHVIPRSRGGVSSWENCVIACGKCNRKKADRTLEEVGWVLAKEPTRPKWRPTFNATVVLDSWEKFVSEMYWNVPIDE